MTVHIDELHSEVVPQADRTARQDREPPWVAQERWQEARRRDEWLAHRVCAVGFDD